MKVLVINSGSSSIKYQLFRMTGRQVLAAGLLERIGLEEGHIIHRVKRGDALEKHEKDLRVEDHKAGLELIAALLTSPEMGVIRHPSEIEAVGHRVVHGGEHFSATTLISEEVLATIRRLIPLAPLHNPANLKGIEVAREIFPSAAQVAVFDTAFHQTLPEEAYRYALPEPFYREHGIRVYGFHGTSHRYVSREAALFLGQPEDEVNLITAHLGNGASITAVRGGKSVDTSMGFSPLPGLMMGTRCGDIDPSIIFYMHRSLGMSIEEIDKVLNRKSGLLGVGGSSDLRDVTYRAEGGDPNARLALRMYAYRIKRYIGAYSAVLSRVDALVFTAGVGENSFLMRRMVCEGLEHLGYVLDEGKNRHPGPGIAEIQRGGSPVKILIVPTDEELEIAIQTEKILKAPRKNGRNGAKVNPPRTI